MCQYVHIRPIEDSPFYQCQNVSISVVSFIRNICGTSNYHMNSSSSSDNFEQRYQWLYLIPGPSRILALRDCISGGRTHQIFQNLSYISSAILVDWSSRSQISALRGRINGGWAHQIFQHWASISNVFRCNIVNQAQATCIRTSPLFRALY